MGRNKEGGDGSKARSTVSQETTAGYSPVSLPSCSIPFWYLLMNRGWQGHGGGRVFKNLENCAQ